MSPLGSNERLIFEIALYRLSKAERRASDEVRVQGFVEAMGPTFGEDRARSIGMGHRDPLWQYNEVVGWLQVAADAGRPGVKVYRWGVDRLRFRANFTPHPFVYQGKVGEALVSRYATNSEAFARVDAELRQVGKRAKRHIDLTAWGHAGPHLDWSRLLRLSPPADRLRTAGE